MVDDLSVVCMYFAKHAMMYSDHTPGSTNGSLDTSGFSEELRYILISVSAPHRTRAV